MPQRWKSGCQRHDVAFRRGVMTLPAGHKSLTTNPEVPSRRRAAVPVAVCFESNHVSDSSRINSASRRSTFCFERTSSLHPKQHTTTRAGVPPCPPTVWQRAFGPAQAPGGQHNEGTRAVGSSKVKSTDDEPFTPCCCWPHSAQLLLAATATCLRVSASPPTRTAGCGFGRRMRWDNHPGVWLRTRGGPQRVMRDPTSCARPNGLIPPGVDHSWRGDRDLAIREPRPQHCPSRAVEVMTDTATVNVWAPELFYDNVRARHVVWARVCPAALPGHRGRRQQPPALLQHHARLPHLRACPSAPRPAIASSMPPSSSAARATM